MNESTQRLGAPSAPSGSRTSGVYFDRSWCCCGRAGACSTKGIAAGAAGSDTLARALVATELHRPLRVIECRPVSASGVSS